MEKYKAPPEMTHLLLNGIIQAIQNPNTEGPSNIPAELESVASAQGKIGWQHILKGRLSKAWIAYLEQSIQHEATQFRNAVTWATDIIRTMLSQWLDLWKLRNEDRHGQDYVSKRAAERNQAIREVEQLYEFKGRIQPEDAWIFHTPIEQQRTKSTYVLRAFLSNYKPLVNGSYQTRLETG
jgi:hypothetical protein